MCDDVLRIIGEYYVPKEFYILKRMDFIHYGMEDDYTIYSTKERTIKALKEYIKNHEYYEEMLQIDNNYSVNKYMDIDTFLKHIENGKDGFFHYNKVSIHKIDIDQKLDVPIYDKECGGRTASDRLSFRKYKSEF